MVSLNVGTLTSVYNANLGKSSVVKDPMTSAFKVALTPNTQAHHSRSLLWATEEPVKNTTDFIPKCSMYFNQSESIRLDNQLRGWFQPEPAMTNTTKTKNKNAPTSPIKEQNAQPYETSLGPFAKPLANGLTSSVYQMLINTDSESK